jgi:hypothetical protein
MHPHTRTHRVPRTRRRPPENAGAEMLQSTVPSLLAVKRMVLLTKEGTRKARATASEDLMKKEAWSKEWVKNEQVKELFQLWETQMYTQLAPKSLDPAEGMAEAPIPEDYRELLEDGGDLVVMEEGKAGSGVKIARGGSLKGLVEWMSFRGASGGWGLVLSV